MEKLAPRRLQDLAPFAEFERLAKRFKVDFTLYGGTASRAAMRLYHRPGEDLDIFDLAPFSSDIDIEHSGTGEQTREILAAIQEDVPFASWFRWSLIDSERGKLAAAARAVSTQVPLRQVRFSTAEAAAPTDQALLDLEQRTVSFVRNPGYGASHLAATGSDVELYGLMMALNVEAELHEILGETPRTDQAEAVAWLRSASPDDFAAALASPRLAARFWHLLAMRLARLGREGAVTSALLDLAASSDILGRFGLYVEDLDGRNQAFSVSKLTGAGAFRVPDLAPQIAVGDHGREVLGMVMRDLWKNAGLSLHGFPEDPTDLIDPAYDLVAVVPTMVISADGGSLDTDEDRDDGDAFLSGLEQEFVEIAWRHADDLKLDPHGLTAQILPWRNIAHLAEVSALPAVGGVFGEDRPWIRARLDDLVERNDGAADGKATLVILQARHE